MNKYIQQFLDDNDLQAGEKFYILDKDHEKISNELFYINKNFEKPEDILKCASRNGGYSYNLHGKGRIYHLEYTKLADSERGRL